MNNVLIILIAIITIFICVTECEDTAACFLGCIIAMAGIILGFAGIATGKNFFEM